MTVNITTTKYSMGQKNICQIRKIAGCACAENAGNVFPPPRVSDPDMHHGTCVTHVPWCMPGSLTIGFLWSRWWGKRSRHSRRMRNPQFYVSGKRSITKLSANITVHPVSITHCANMTLQPISLCVVYDLHGETGHRRILTYVANPGIISWYP